VCSLQDLPRTISIRDIQHVQRRTTSLLVCAGDICLCPVPGGHDLGSDTIQDAFDRRDLGTAIVYWDGDRA